MFAATLARLAPLPARRRARRGSGPRTLVGLAAGISGATAALGVGACSHTVTVEGHRAPLTLLEYRLRPAGLVVAPGTLRLAVANLGRLTHNLTVLAPARIRVVVPNGDGARGVRTVMTSTTTAVAATPDLAPGSATTLTVSLRPGHYRLASTVGADAGLGMAGTLTVVSK